MTSQVVRTLESKGLLQRQTDPTDSRARHLRPTAAGIETAQRAIAAVETVDAEAFSDPAPHLLTVLRRVSSAPTAAT